MAITLTKTANTEHRAPAVDDMGIYLLDGRAESATSVIEEARDAERLGFTRVWVEERYSNKHAGVILGAAGAVTSRIGLGTGLIPLGSRPALVTASIATTLQSAFGPRVALGVGRSETSSWLAGCGFNEIGYPALVEYVDIIRRLIAGEHVKYEGAAGSLDIRIDDIPPGPPPPVIFFCTGGPRASRAAANPAFDGVAFVHTLTPQAIHNSIAWLTEECERIGRDPATIRKIACVNVAADTDDYHIWKHVGARVVVYLQAPFWGELLCKRNGWDEQLMHDIRNDRRLQGIYADHDVHRGDLGQIAKDLVPESLLTEVGAVGTANECVHLLERYRSAGVDEFIVNGGSPSDHAGLIAAWRTREM